MKDLAHLLTTRSVQSETDRLVVLTALLDLSGCEPFYRQEVIEVPPHHLVYGWACQVHGCEAVSGASGLCRTHLAEWSEARTAMSRPEYVASASPVRRKAGIPSGRCRICPDRPAMSRVTRLCSQHKAMWHREKARNPEEVLEGWAARQTPTASLGECRVPTCWDSAASPIGLCVAHVRRYREAGHPGNARFRPGSPQESLQGSVTVAIDDEIAYQRWLSEQEPLYRLGYINLKGCDPTLIAELQWGFWAHTQQRNATRWTLSAMERLVNICRVRGVTSLTGLSLDGDGKSGPSHSQIVMMVREIVNGLRTACHTPEQTRALGFLETDHFGRRFPGSRSHYDLTEIRQRWLRDLVWDHMAEKLRSVDAPRSRGPFDALRRAAIEFGAFLELDAPEGGHDPRVLGAEHVERFVADMRRRARERRTALAVTRSDGQTSIVTETTRRIVFNSLRAMFMRALEEGRTESLGVAVSFATAFPAGGTDVLRHRAPFDDRTAQALVDEDNLAMFARENDSRDRGLRDIWEAIVLTGRRSQEILRLRLDCIGRYSGLPVLWHDQTKVGRYDQAIRIPERLYQRIDARRAVTVERFVTLHGRAPTSGERANMALFPTHIRNHNFERSVSYTAFSAAFRAWVDALNLGSAVPHQARHTMATRLLEAGANLAHIRRYLGHVSDRMAEVYAHVSDTSLDSVLSTVWVSGPGSSNPGVLLSTGEALMTREQATTLALDLTRRSTPTEGGFCTFQPVVNGSACPWKLNCEGCDHFVMSGADLVYWRRKQEQWRSIAERAPDDRTAEYLHNTFEPTARAIAGLEQALSGIGLLDQALQLDLRSPQDYFHRIWSVGFPAAELATHGGPSANPSEGEAESDT